MIDPTKPKPDPRPSMTSAQRAAWDHLRFDIEPSVRWQSIVDCCGVCARGAEMEAEELVAEALARWAVCLWLCTSPDWHRIERERRAYAAARGTPAHACEGCGQTDRGATLHRGWYRCNRCGYPSQ